MQRLERCRLLLLFLGCVEKWSERILCQNGEGIDVFVDFVLRLLLRVLLFQANLVELASPSLADVIRAATLLVSWPQGVKSIGCLVGCPRVE